MNIEKRVFDLDLLEVREDESPKIRGHAAVFNKTSDNLGFIEIIEPGFFRNAVRKSDTAALWNHNSDIILGRKSAKTLKLEEDDSGLYYEIDPPSWASGYVESIKRGDVKQSSFAFIVKNGGDKWEDKEGVRYRTLLDGGCDELLDVSPVVYPAYPQTDVKVRMSDSDLELIKNTVSSEIDRHLHQPDETPDDQGEPPHEGRVDSLDIKKKRLDTYKI